MTRRLPAHPLPPYGPDEMKRPSIYTQRPSTTEEK